MAITHEPTNQEWLDALRSAENGDAIERLRLHLVRGLRYALAGRVAEEQVETLSEDFAQEALLRVLDSLDSFRGESRFTTWAMKIAVRVAFSELRRKRWQDVSLEALTETEEGEELTPSFLADPSPTPEQQSNRRTATDLVNRLMAEALTERQRTALQAILVMGMPIEEVARRMGTNRNALYKLLHDARLKMQRALAEQGLTPDELLAMMDET